MILPWNAKRAISVRRQCTVSFSLPYGNEIAGPSAGFLYKRAWSPRCEHACGRTSYQTSDGSGQGKTPWSSGCERGHVTSDGDRRQLSGRWHIRSDSKSRVDVGWSAPDRCLLRPTRIASDDSRALDRARLIPEPLPPRLRFPAKSRDRRSRCAVGADQHQMVIPIPCRANTSGNCGWSTSIPDSVASTLRRPRLNTA